MQRRCSRALGLSHLSIPIADMHVTETILLLSPPSHFIDLEKPVLWSTGVQMLWIETGIVWRVGSMGCCDSRALEDKSGV